MCENDGSRIRESVDKKVRGWLNGRNQPTRREELMELCFILRPDSRRADAFLAACSDAGLHWREPIYAFALDWGMLKWDPSGSASLAYAPEDSSMLGWAVYRLHRR